MDKIDIKSLSLDELKEQMREMGEKPFRADQIFINAVAEREFIP